MINAAHGIENVESPTGISGSMQTTKITSADVFIFWLEQPNISVNRASATPATVAISANPLILRVIVSPSYLNDG